MIDQTDSDNIHSQDSSSLINSFQTSSQSSSSSPPSQGYSLAQNLRCKKEENEFVKLEDNNLDSMDLEVQQQESLQQMRRSQWKKQQLEKLKSQRIKKGLHSSDDLEVQFGGIDDLDLYYDEDENGVMNDEEVRNMHYGVEKMPTASLSDSGQGIERQVIGEHEMLLQHFVMKKQIAKMKKNSSKKFVKKILTVQPTFFKEITCQSKFMIFGYSQLEQFYRDYEDQNDPNLILQCRYVVDINRLVDNFADNFIEVYYNVKGKSGLTDFRFIIDHYSKMPCQHYHELAELLKQYQHLVSISVSHMSKINRMLRFQMLSEDEIASAFNQAEQYFKGYVKRKYRSNPGNNLNYSDYVMFTTVRNNYHTLDMDVYSNVYSKQLFELFGFNQSALELLKAINTPFQMPLGDSRLKDMINLIKIYVSHQNLYNVPITFYTQDGIQVTTTVDCEILNWPDAPEWMIPLDNFVILLKFNLTQRELSQVNGYRALPKQIEYNPQCQNQSAKKKSKLPSEPIDEESDNEIQIKNSESSQSDGAAGNEGVSVVHQGIPQHQDAQYSTDKFEYIMQSELFLEKFYPNLNSLQQVSPAPTSLQKQAAISESKSKSKKKSPTNKKIQKSTKN